jgi:hypothetical protein
MSDADDQMGGQGGRTGLSPEQQSDEAPDSTKGNVGGKPSQADGPGQHADPGGAESDGPGSESVDEAGADSFPASDPPGYR